MWPNVILREGGNRRRSQNSGWTKDWRLHPHHPHPPLAPPPPPPPPFYSGKFQGSESSCYCHPSLTSLVEFPKSGLPSIDGCLQPIIINNLFFLDLNFLRHLYIETRSNWGSYGAHPLFVCAQERRSSRHWNWLTWGPPRRMESATDAPASFVPEHKKQTKVSWCLPASSFFTVVMFCIIPVHLLLVWHGPVQCKLHNLSQVIS